ncbi:iron chelate uptake ABC transporter permease subunit VctG [Vibrio salinus]|uniref:iron chelate uptake ABC transporter permease subunit VctG n=1 Tax=Vibrio salinus TaxID=2899784 RepID=UPI001E62E919|nr:iron chelate uptake ABC transporter permease subunit VctG [Vibrio salinus]MCE0496066.1 iron chelate uptake ABC transporter permease subunit VctG [Vibrio salinus]
MKDSAKVVVLVVASLVVMALFIGIGLTPGNYEFFLARRIPKVLAIILAGIALALSSLSFQTITHNRILTPGVMGFDFLYQFTQVLLVMIFGGLSSFVTGAYWNFSLSASVMLVFSFLLFAFYFRSGKGNLITLLLLGVVIGQVFNNMTSFLVVLMDPNDFASVQANLFASFNHVNVNLVYSVTPLLLITSFLLFRMNPIFDVFWLNRDNAVSLGVDVQKVTRNTLLLIAVLISISTALVGPILFFGVLVTNLTREWFQTYRHSVLLTGCSAMSVCFLLSGQWLVEKVFNFDTTLSVVINFIGGIYFLTLLMRNKVV